MLILSPVHSDGDPLRTRLDLLNGGTRRKRGDGPVRPGVAANGGDAGLRLVELNAGLDPFIGRRRGCSVGESEQEASLVVLGGVRCGEGDGSGLEVVEGAFAVGTEGGCDLLAEGILEKENVVNHLAAC